MLKYVSQSSQWNFSTMNLADCYSFAFLAQTSTYCITTGQMCGEPVGPHPHPHPLSRAGGICISSGRDDDDDDSLMWRRSHETNRRTNRTKRWMCFRSKHTGLLYTGGEGRNVVGRDRMYAVKWWTSANIVVCCCRWWFLGLRLVCWRDRKIVAGVGGGEQKQLRNAMLCSFSYSIIQI